MPQEKFYRLRARCTISSQDQDHDQIGRSVDQNHKFRCTNQDRRSNDVWSADQTDRSIFGDHSLIRGRYLDCACVDQILKNWNKIVYILFTWNIILIVFIKLLLTMSEAAKSKNFSSAEKDVLMGMIELHRDVIECKRTDTVTAYTVSNKHAWIHLAIQIYVYLSLTKFHILFIFSIII